MLVVSESVLGDLRIKVDIWQIEEGYVGGALV